MSDGGRDANSGYDSDAQQVAVGQTVRAARRPIVVGPSAGAAVTKHGSVLQEAARLVRGARNDDYGDPVKMYEGVAKLWSAMLGVQLTAVQVLEMMILLKVGRELVTHKKDNLIDIAGYTELLAVAKGEAEL